MAHAAETPVTAVRVERAGDQHRIHLLRADGRFEMINAAAVAGGLRTSGDVLAELLSQGVPLDDAAHCVSEIDPGFDAQAALARRPHRGAATG
ncbi:hypothetical protein [Actinoplanes sp. GCM10030250]|uniref:hypothetical protein n=1 Tax=Actinoplanes sp. GCM10030250 TaxID=3273376 RepID=UPI0036235EDF